MQQLKFNMINMGNLTNIFGYIILGVSILITTGWCLNIRAKAKKEQVTEKALELQGFLMTLSIILVLTMGLSPFHLLWMIPTSFILGLMSMNSPLRILWVFSSIYFSIWYVGISNQGRKYYLAGDYDKAIEAFKEEINNNHFSAETYFNLGCAYGKLGKHDNEIAAYEEAIKLDPKRPELYFNLGTVLNNIGEKDKAIETLKEAILLRPEYLKAHYAACRVYSEVGDRENVIKELKILKKIDSKVADELEQIIKME